MEKACHYISVIHYNGNFYKLDGEPTLIIDIANYMQQHLIVLCMYQDMTCFKIIDPVYNSLMESLFVLNENFTPFKFHQTNPFLHLHPELANSNNLIEADLISTTEQSTTTHFSEELNYLSSDDEINYSIIDSLSLTPTADSN